MPQIFRKLVKIQPAQDVIERFGTHIRTENLAPALFQFAVATFGQESEWTRAPSIHRDHGHFGSAKPWI